MKSVVELEIDAPQAKVAQLFADPTNSEQWMETFKHYEPISGTPGQLGSKYRLVPEHGDPFVATVVGRDMPRQSKLELDAPTVAVSITCDMVELPADKTKLISREVFRFKGVLHKLLGLVARRKIHHVHKQQMQAFKRFAEHHA